MKIINWLFSSKPQYLEVEQPPEHEDFTIIENPYGAEPETTQYRKRFPEMIPCVIVTEMGIVRLKSNLILMRKGTTLNDLRFRIVVDNMLPRSGWYFYVLIDSFAMTTKKLLTATRKLEELDALYFKDKDCLTIYMGRESFA